MKKIIPWQSQVASETDWVTEFHHVYVLSPEVQFNDLQVIKFAKKSGNLTYGRDPLNHQAEK
jgi:hypothetical protein